LTVKRVPSSSWPVIWPVSLLTLALATLPSLARRMNSP
jgi:hypothetical protein